MSLTASDLGTVRRQRPLLPAQGTISVVVHGQDRAGIVTAVTGVLARRGANIVSLDQYSDDPEGGHFFQRTVARLHPTDVDIGAVQDELRARVGNSFGLQISVRDLSVPKRVAILVSRSDHCLLDLLWRQRRGELPIDVSMVISNHHDVAEDVGSFGIPFFHVPSLSGGKSAMESRILELAQDKVDFLVLARYMQILSAVFVDRVGVPIINIHHSFLPAFIGAGPYAKAKDRGVKLIGATAHYVTSELDQGPIIEQDVVRVSHADSARDMARRGADVERMVLFRAVLWHSEDRIIRHQNHTIVFPR